MSLRSISVALDYLGEDQGALQYPASVEDFVGLTIEGNRQAIRFGDLFTNYVPDVIDEAHLLRCLRRALLRNGQPEPNSQAFRTVVNTLANSVTGEGGFWLPRRNYYVGTIEAMASQDQNDRQWRMYYSESLQTANGPYPGGSANITFHDHDVAAQPQPSPDSLVKDLPGALRRRWGAYVNPPAFEPNALELLRERLNSLVLEY